MGLLNERKAGKNGLDLKDESCGLVGSEFHAEAVPDWSVITSESHSKWFDTLIWQFNREQNNNNLLIERDPIGNADSNKMLTMLVSAMGECALSIVREPEPQYFDEDFLHDFCISTLKHVANLHSIWMFLSYMGNKKLRSLSSDIISLENVIPLLFNAIDLDSIKFSKAKSIGFELSIHESDITIDEINRTASKLVSSVRK
ncbi:hypothetical protein Bca52824_050216 [Brassica carinata]|uniref:Separase-like TPR repeats region domain-containing protein n=1 Tax=Brassica carinata TaxID=52824 RepID=A0A8X7UTT6_BRACI|nr:hypothetical protein Bca52824_050216 [Brassica carinata]